MELAVFIIIAAAVVLLGMFTFKTVRIVPQARARNVERLGRYRKTPVSYTHLTLPTTPYV